MGELAAISGISRQELQQLLVALGYRAVAEAGGRALLLGLAVGEKAAMAVRDCGWTTVTHSPSYES